MAFGNATKGYVKKHGGSGGGSGGGGGTAVYERETLYVGSEKVNNMTLTSSYKNYDYLLIQCCASVGDINYLNSVVINVSDVTNGDLVGVSDDLNFSWYTITSDTTLSLASSQGDYFIKSVTGIKFN
jgi:hypothetical protein